MYLTTYQPWNLLNQFRNDLDQFFEHSGNHQLSNDSTTATTYTWTPAVDIKEETNHFLIEADIPGVEPKDIEVSMVNGVLTIKGERKIETQSEGKNYQRVERMHGSFYRRFSLPDTADPDKISANGKEGVLQITIPKRALAQPRRITVQV